MLASGTGMRQHVHFPVTLLGAGVVLLSVWVPVVEAEGLHLLTMLLPLTGLPKSY